MSVEIKYPGVYVEEVPSGVRSIPGVSTSTAAFAGWAAMGPTDRAEHVSSWVDFESKFGGLDPDSLLGYSVLHFFENGGRGAYIVRLTRGGDAAVIQPNEPAFEKALLPESGIGGLFHLDVFNLLCVPGETNAGTIAALQRFCRDRRAFLIVDCDPAATFNDMKSGPSAVTGGDAMNSALYFPWVLAPDKLQNNLEREFPPCGFVAGIYARTDAATGVWKAPAGNQASMVGVTGVAVNKRLTNDQNGVLNPKAINCIRVFPNYGTVVWGSRTLHGRDELASDWKYIPVRRTALFIEGSIYQGMQWVVFEPNGEPLWAQIRLSVGGFMYDLFRQGAFQGLTPNESYFIKCDSQTTTQNDVNLGIVNVMVGFAPLKPAEFVIIRVQLMTASKEDTAGQENSVMPKPNVNNRRSDPYKNFNFRLRTRTAKPKPEDIRLPKTEMAVLDQILEEGRRSDLVGDVATANARALFVGPRGTGKTMAAEVIADELGVDLYRVDLSSIVSKYIGETEKHLERVFDAAEEAGAILFFDEADALFGKRTGVRDSHDRYANIETGYFLRRLESYPGVVIVATNMKQAIDTAFLRRLRFVVDFTVPDRRP